MKQVLQLPLLIGLSACAAVNLSPSKKTTDLSFAEGNSIEATAFVFPDTTGNLYLRQLRHE